MPSPPFKVKVYICCLQSSSLDSCEPLEIRNLVFIDNYSEELKRSASKHSATK